MKKSLFISIAAVVGITLVTFTGTYAYFLASVSENFSGNTESGINTKLSLENIHIATKLIPLSDKLIETAISKENNKCIDKNNREVCSLYKITLTNTEESEKLYGYIRTVSSTYKTNNLKYQLFDNSYTAVTDIMEMEHTADSLVYFTKDSDYYISSSVGTNNYYLAIWLSDTGISQSDDYSKEYDGYIGFELIGTTGTGRIEAEF